MGRLAWGAKKQRIVETGISKAVLYIDGRDGVLWNGIISMSSTPDGGEDTSLHADNFVYARLRSAENYKGKIEAYQSPEEFGECDGTYTVIPGMFIGQQQRKPFNLCYRTEIIGQSGEDSGYKIHIIYNATASPSEKTHSTFSDSPDAIKFSWEFSTTPHAVEGYKPFSEIILDSTKIDKLNLDELEAILYGTGDYNAYMPTPEVVLNIVNMNRVARMILDVFALHGHWRWDDFNFDEDTVPIAIDRESLTHIVRNPGQNIEYVQPTVTYAFLSADRYSQKYSVVVIDQKNPSELCSDMEANLNLTAISTVKIGDFYHHSYELTI